MQTIDQDILTVTGPAIICHQVNCQRVMGSGLALQIRTKWPHVFDAYSQKRRWELGDCQIVTVGDNQYVANLAGQRTYGEGLRTNYGALEYALDQAYDFTEANELVLYIPHSLGCGLAGGNWEMVLDIIAKVAPNAVICKLPE
jgi:O-acetyl-ADP-ribose deacetylase (regulator of RNase III)